MRHHGRQQPLVRELLARLVERLGHAVAEDHDGIARLQRQRLLVERPVGEEPEDDAPRLEPADTVGRDEHRRVMARVRVGERAIRREHAVERRHKARLDVAA